MAPKSNSRELRALLWLLPVLAVSSWLVWEVATATADFGYVETGKDSLPMSLRGADGDEANQDSEAGLLRADTPRNDEASDMAGSPTPQLFSFDPNTVEYHDLVKLGFSRGEALGIIKYRERGKVFEIPEDLAACYQVSEEMYRRLEPYISIGEKYRLKSWAEARPSLRGADSDEAIRTPDSGLLRNSSASGIQTPRNDVAGTPRSRETLVDLNTADSAVLISVAGIGPGTVGAIMAYRTRLGGFVSVEQLAEVRGVTEQNYERIIEQIYLDPAVIQKIDINFAPAKTLAAHPYIGAGALRKLLKQRQLKGGWRSITELVTDDIFTEDELRKLGPYLIFN